MQPSWAGSGPRSLLARPCSYSLDSNHSRDHVRAELEAYAPLVSVGSYLVATDGVMQEVADAPRGQPSWATDNPISAVHDFLRSHPGVHARAAAVAVQ